MHRPVIDAAKDLLRPAMGRRELGPASLLQVGVAGAAAECVSDVHLLPGILPCLPAYLPACRVPCPSPPLSSTSPALTLPLPRPQALYGLARLSHSHPRGPWLDAWCAALEPHVRRVGGWLADAPSGWAGGSLAGLRRLLCIFLGF